MADNLNKLIKHHYNTNNSNYKQNNKNKEIITSLSNKNILIASNASKNNVKNNNKKNNCIINHSNSFTNLKNQNLSVQTINSNIIKDKYLKSKSISKFYLKNNSTINKSKTKTKHIQIPKCNGGIKNDKKNIFLNIKIGKKNNESSFNLSNKKKSESYSIDKTPLNTNHKINSKINNYYSHTQSYSNINKIKNGNTQSCININKEFLFDKLNEKKTKKMSNNNGGINEINNFINNKYLENINIHSIKNLKIDTELNKYLINLNKEYQTFNDTFTESPINVKICEHNKKNMNYSDINNFYNNNIFNTNNISDNDIIKNFKGIKNIIPNNFIKNKYLQSTYNKVTNFFNNINSTRNSINVNVFQNIKNNNKNNVNKYNHLKYNSSNNIINNFNSYFNQKWKLSRKNNSSLNLNKNKKKKKNSSVEIIDKINFNIKNINISNNFIKKIDNVKLIKPTYQIKLDIIKRRTINMLEFYINLAKNAVDQNINNIHYN